jgi:uncharacterized protein YkwD
MTPFLTMIRPESRWPKTGVPFLLLHLLWFFCAPETNLAGASRITADANPDSLLLYDHGDPTGFEQYLLELINRARADPLAEAARADIDLNEGLQEGAISPDPKPPLAFHEALIEAARDHSRWMLLSSTFSHTGQGDSSPSDRMGAAGYPFVTPWTAGENIGWSGTTGTPDLQELLEEIHLGLFRSPGHRLISMSPDFNETGLGVIEGAFTFEETTFNSLMIAEKFARSGGTPGAFLTGVVYQDLSGDQFYSPGEGIAGVLVQIQGQSHSALTSSSGGFAIPLDPGSMGPARVTVSSTEHSLAGTAEVALTGQNVLIHFEAASLRSLRFLPATLERTPAGVLQGTVQVPAPGVYRVETSQDLQAWSLLDEFTVNENQFTFTDQSAPQFPHRFYRALKIE